MSGKFLKLSILLLIMFHCRVSALRGYPKAGRSAQKDDSYVFLCLDYEKFGFNPSSPFSPEDSNRVRLLESTSWAQRGNDYLPDVELLGGGGIRFCLDGNKTIKVVETISDTFNYTYSLNVAPNNGDISQDPLLEWRLVSKKISPISGGYIIDLTISTKTWWYLNLENNTLAMYDCHPNGCDPDVLEGLQISFHSVKFVPDTENGIDFCWTGLFVLCADRNCEYRVNTVQINGENIQLLPVFIWPACFP